MANFNVDYFCRFCTSVLLTRRKLLCCPSERVNGWVSKCNITIRAHNELSDFHPIFSDLIEFTGDVFFSFVLFLFLVLFFSEYAGTLLCYIFGHSVVKYDILRAKLHGEFHRGLKFQPRFWNKSSSNEIADFMEKDSAWCAIQHGLKIPARYF